VPLKSSTDDSDKVRFYFTIGKMLYNKNRIDEAIMYLVPGYKLSLLYPANVPTFDSIEEYNGIMKVIKDNMN
jgi:hypothetical protein